MGEEPVLDIGDGAADNFMAMAKAAMAKAGGGPVKVDFQETAGVKAAQERASQRQALKQAIADQAGYKVDVSKPVGGGGGAPMVSPRRTAQEEEILDAESAAAAAAEKAEKKAATEKAAAKTASDQAAVQALLKRAAAAAVDDVTAVDEEKIKQVPLRWTSAKLGAGVSLGSDGAVASAGALAVQLTDVWMPGGRKPLIWTVAIALDDVQPDTMIGVVGRNFFPSDWERSLATSPHAVAMRCGDGSIRHKGKGTSFILRPLTSGARLNFIIDMQASAPRCTGAQPRARATAPAVAPRISNSRPNQSRPLRGVPPPPPHSPRILDADPRDDHRAGGQRGWGGALVTDPREHAVGAHDRGRLRARQDAERARRRLHLREAGDGADGQAEEGLVGR